MTTFAILAFVLCAFLTRVSGHSSLWHPSMYGFNVTAETFPYDNRPVAPLRDMNFSTWWFHNHLEFAPNPGDIFELPAGKPATTEIACNKGATSFFASSEGGDIRDPTDLNNPCPKSPTTAFHTHGLDELEGCALAIAYKNDARAVQPDDFTVFSVNQTCVWTRFTDFQVPQRMPPCPDGGCICAFFWIHSPKGGGEENYMNGFKCNVTGSTSIVPLAKPRVARRCGADPDNKKLQSAPGNCTYGAKAPFYWFQAERNNMFEGAFSPPVYNDLYNFIDGAQNDIFDDSYLSIPEPSPNAALPVLNGTNGTPISIDSIPSSGVTSSSNSSFTIPSSGSSTTNSSTTAPPPPPVFDYRRGVRSPWHYRRDLRRSGNLAFGKGRKRLSGKHRHRLQSV